MVINQNIKIKKDLNRYNPKNKSMKKRVTYSKLKGEKLIDAIKEAQKDPEFIREINKFIKITTS